MNPRALIRNVLLAFAAVSSAYVIAGEIAGRRGGSRPMDTAAIGPATRLVVYFFSEGKECATCEQIPACAREALDTYFAAELKSGAIVWAAIDVDDPRNRHYLDVYNIYTKSIVLSRVANGKEVRWKVLDKVWDLIYDRPAFVEYVRAEVRAELDAPP